MKTMGYIFVTEDATPSPSLRNRRSPLLRSVRYRAECLHLLLEMGNRRGVATTLEAMAYLQVKLGAFMSATQLSGAADSLRTELGSPIPPGEQGEHQTYTERLQTALGRAEYNQMFAEGQAMTLAEACTLAFTTT